MLGGIWGCILFKLKEYTPRPPKKNSGRDFDFPPRPSLKRPKEGPQPFLWKLSWSHGRFSGDRRGRFAARFTGDVGTGDGSWRLWCLRSFRAFCLAEDEGDEGPADLEPALGVRCPIPLRIPLLSVGGGLCPAPSGVASYSDDHVGADLCVRMLSRSPQGKAPLCKGSCRGFAAIEGLPEVAGHFGDALCRMSHPPLVTAGANALLRWPGWPMGLSLLPVGADAYDRRPNFGTKFGRRRPCLRYIGPLLHTTIDR